MAVPECHVRPPSSLASACCSAVAKVEEKGVISLNGVGDTGSRPDPWSMVGLDGRQAPPLLYGCCQWPWPRAMARRQCSGL